jgi:hypothetical protein
MKVASPSSEALGVASREQDETSAADATSAQNRPACESFSDLKEIIRFPQAKGDSAKVGLERVVLDHAGLDPRAFDFKLIAGEGKLHSDSKALAIVVS